MGRRLPARLTAAFLLVLLAACQPTAETVVDVAEEAGEAAADPIGDAEVVVAKVAAPVIGTVKDAAAVVAEALPEPPPPPATDPRVVAHIVRWEVSGESAYQRKYQGVICPGGASGPTIGIGYDLGHQAAATIQRDWAFRPDVDRLASAAGKVGPAQCAATRKAMAGVRVPWPEALAVFEGVSMPHWQRVTARAYPGIDGMGRLAEGAVRGNTYNRGTSMLGSRAKEKREIRDVCIPRLDAECVATQLEAQCRIWQGTDLYAGLCGRRRDEARLARIQA
ncbi:hypothetical protein MASR1M8_15800 [Thermomonas brevis]